MYKIIYLYKYFTLLRKKIIIIGIDIDDVLNNQYAFMIDYGSMYSERQGGYELVNPNSSETPEIFGWSRELSRKFWHEYMPIFYTFSAVSFAGEVIKKLRVDGHKICIITARHNDDWWFPEEMVNKVEELTLKWLVDNSIEYDKIVFGAFDKAGGLRKSKG